MADETVEQKTDTENRTDTEKKVEEKPSAQGSQNVRSASRPQQQRPYQRRQSGGQGRRGHSGPRRFQGRSRFHRRKVCAFCVDKSLVIDWKRIENFRRFVADSGAIQPRRKSGLCARHQRRVAVAVKRARHLAMIPYTTEQVRIMGKS